MEAGVLSVDDVFNRRLHVDYDDTGGKKVSAQRHGETERERGRDLGIEGRRRDEDDDNRGVRDDG
jgi:hypothetical protein